MSSVEVKRLLEVTDAVTDLLRDSHAFHAAYPTHQLIANAFADTLSRVLALKRRFDEVFTQQRFAFVGSSNSGKSTLLNCLLGPGGAPVSPQGKIVRTTCPIEYSFGDSYSLSSNHPGQLTHSSETFASSGELHVRLQGLLTTRVASQRPSRLHVTVPIQLLKRTSTTFIDTPSFGQLPTNFSSVTQESRLRDYIQAQKPHLFWVVYAEHSVSRRELKCFVELSSNLPYDLVITGTEQWSPSDRSRFTDWLRSALANQQTTQLTPTVMPVSAHRALLALQRNSKPAIEESGFMAFVQRIRTLARNDTSSQKYRQELEGLIRDLSIWLCEYRPRAPKTVINPYHPASLARWFMSEAGCPLRRSINTHIQLPLQ